jgi:hypothetical protein
MPRRGVSGASFGRRYAAASDTWSKYVELICEYFTREGLRKHREGNELTDKFVPAHPSRKKTKTRRGWGTLRWTLVWCAMQIADYVLTRGSEFVWIFRPVRGLVVELNR